MRHLGVLCTTRSRALPTIWDGVSVGSLVLVRGTGVPWTPSTYLLLTMTGIMEGAAAQEEALEVLPLVWVLPLLGPQLELPLLGLTSSKLLAPCPELLLLLLHSLLGSSLLKCRTGDLKQLVLGL